MRLSKLIASNKNLTLRGDDVDIASLTADSRKVKPGALFIAIPGMQHDGRAFIAYALQHGAAAILVPQQDGEPYPATSESLLTCSGDLRQAIASLAATFTPRQPKTIAAITGTSGKTSTAQFTREIWQIMGHASASIGTLGLVTKNETRYGSLTTPDAITLHQMLDECASHGISHVALEASSHGLSMHRLDQVHLTAGGFTNLSRDHLDYHATMEAYFAAKLRLFTELLPTGSAAILNADSPEYTVLTNQAKQRGLRVLSYGNTGKDLKLIAANPSSQGQILRLEILGATHEILLPVIGTFQVWNALCALGLVIGSGGEVGQATQALSHLSGVPGRLQKIGTTATGGTVFVDYAHKPDALDHVLTALRPHVAAHKGAKLGVVFGCGGNRDAGKRPLMGAIAARLADWTIITDDNPRHEDPTAIRHQILGGFAAAQTPTTIPDRAAAIAEGIARLGAHDVLVIAGKGHETGQIIGDTVLPFDDAAVARAHLES